ncbi:hypothetical protein ACOME3_004648, partial [Neoechinorhynchus agilis]
WPNTAETKKLNNENNKEVQSHRLEQIASSPVPDIYQLEFSSILKHIPKGARTQVAQSYTNLLQRCAENNEDIDWGNLTSNIKNRLVEFDANLKRMTESSASPENSSSKSRKQGTVRPLGQRVSAKLADGDVR